MKNRLQIFLSLLFGLFFIVWNLKLYAADKATPIQQTQSQLKALDTQILKLQNILKQARDKRSLLNKELSLTEKNIGTTVFGLRRLQQEINQNQAKITDLESKVHTLKSQQTHQQQQLAKHLRIRYQMGEYQPLKWLLNQEDPNRLSRVLTYYQYIVKARVQLIESMKQTQKQLSQNQGNLQKEAQEKIALQEQLTNQQQKLFQNKDYHKALIFSLNNEIQSKEQQLVEFERNKRHLTRLLKSLAKKSLANNTQSFIPMHKKLPMPVQTERRSIQKMNQGLAFFTQEGAPVIAVSSGKVVFSDWLKGYGLLLIIDHGQGFMSLYAHNESLFKQKGEIVSQNEQIASVGHTGGIKQNGLYFEIRHRGKAVPPLEWLS